MDALPEKILDEQSPGHLQAVQAPHPIPGYIAIHYLWVCEAEGHWILQESADFRMVDVGRAILQNIALCNGYCSNGALLPREAVLPFDEAVHGKLPAGAVLGVLDLLLRDGVITNDASLLA
eukprot:2069906-Rhodomonas_salina.2